MCLSRHGNTRGSAVSLSVEGKPCSLARLALDANEIIISLRVPINIRRPRGWKPLWRQERGRVMQLATGRRISRGFAQRLLELRYLCCVINGADGAGGSGILGDRMWLVSQRNIGFLP